MPEAQQSAPVCCFVGVGSVDCSNHSRFKFGLLEFSGFFFLSLNIFDLGLVGFAGVEPVVTESWLCTCLPTCAFLLHFPIIYSGYYFY